MELQYRLIWYKDPNDQPIVINGLSGEGRIATVEVKPKEIKGKQQQENDWHDTTLDILNILGRISDGSSAALDGAKYKHYIRYNYT